MEIKYLKSSVTLFIRLNQFGPCLGLSNEIQLETAKNETWKQSSYFFHPNLPHNFVLMPWEACKAEYGISFVEFIKISLFGPFLGL